MLTTDEITLLQAIHTMKHPTTQMLHTLCFPGRSKRYVEKLLLGLRDTEWEERKQLQINDPDCGVKLGKSRGYIVARRLIPEDGAVSVHYYHVLKRGADAIGIDKLASDHYRGEGDSGTGRREGHIKRSITTVLRMTIARYGWKLYEEETASMHALLRFMQKRAIQEGNTVTPAQLVHLIKRPDGNRTRTKKRDQARVQLGKLPRYIEPDKVIETPKTTILCIIGHWNATDAFWEQRIEKYTSLYRATGIRTVCITMSDNLHDACQAIVKKSAFAKSFLVVTPQTLPSLFEKLGK